MPTELLQSPNQVITANMAVRAAEEAANAFVVGAPRRCGKANKQTGLEVLHNARICSGWGVVRFVNDYIIEATGRQFGQLAVQRVKAGKDQVSIFRSRTSEACRKAVAPQTQHVLEGSHRLQQDLNLVSNK